MPPMNEGRTQLRPRWIVPVLLSAVAFALLVGAAGGATGALATLARTPQRAVAEQWVMDVGGGDLRGACELQAGQESAGRQCATLISSAKPPACPKAGPGAKPPYRKGEIRTVGERVGEFAQESATRGFVRIDAQVRAKGSWAGLGRLPGLAGLLPSLGVELVSDGPSATGRDLDPLTAGPHAR
jgi:hypothetical protein